MSEMRAMWRSAIVFFFVCVGYGASGCRAFDELTTVPQSFGAQVEAPIRWGNSAKLTDPIIEIVFETGSAPFVVDTGSSELLITKEFAQASGISTVREGLVRKRITFKIGNSSVGAERFVVVDAPPLQIEGWGGIFSPQVLTEGATVVLDFPRMRMSSVAAKSSTVAPADGCAEVVRKYFADNWPKTAPHRLEWKGREFGAILILGGLGGRSRVLLDVDTGKAVTAFRPSYFGSTASGGQPGPRLEDIKGVAELTLDFPGQDVQIGNLILGGRRVTVHGSGGTLPSGLVWDGNIGMDILKDAILVLCPRGEDAIYLGVAH